MIIASGATSQSIDVQIVDDTGLPVTGLVAATFPAVSWSLAPIGGTPGAAASITLSDLAAINSAYSSGGVKERSGGVYRLDLPNAAMASTGTVRLIGEATGKHLIAEPIVVGGVNSVAVEDANGNVAGNVARWNNQTVSNLPANFFNLGINANGQVDLQPATIETILRAVYGFKNVYHVLSTGNDTNAGTTAAPFLTVAHAASVAGAGDAIAVGAGTFVETSTATLAAGVTLMGAGMDSTRIQNATSGNVVVVASNCVVRDISIEGTKTPASSVFQMPITDSTNTVTGVLITRVRTKGDTDGLYFTGIGSQVRVIDCVLTSNWDCCYAQNGATVDLIRTPCITTAQNAATPNLNSTIQCVDGSIVRIYGGYVSNTAPNPVFTVTIGGSPTGGTFTLSVTSGGSTQTTAGIAYNAASSAVQTALQSLSNVGSNNAIVSGSAGGPYTVTFPIGLGTTTMTGSAAGLTGGTPSVTVTGGGNASRINNVVKATTNTNTGARIELHGVPIFMAVDGGTQNVLNAGTGTTIVDNGAIYDPTKKSITGTLTHQGANLSPTGLDFVATTVPTTVAGATFRDMMFLEYWRNVGGKAVYDSTANTIKIYAADGTTVIYTQTATVVGGVQTVGAAA